MPLLATDQISNTQSFAFLVIAFLSFSLCASSVYIINDLLDLESDRSYPRKIRPFASAKLSVLHGVFAAPILIVTSFLLGVIVSLDFLIVLLVYLVLTVTYSFVLKRLVLVDCITLAILTLCVLLLVPLVLSVSLSFWLLTFSIFIFLSLAIVKRHTELLCSCEKVKL